MSTIVIRLWYYASNLLIQFLQPAYFGLHMHVLLLFIPALCTDAPWPHGHMARWPHTCTIGLLYMLVELRGNFRITQFLGSRQFMIELMNIINSTVVPDINTYSHVSSSFAREVLLASTLVVSEKATRG